MQTKDLQSATTLELIQHAEGYFTMVTVESPQSKVKRPIKRLVYSELSVVMTNESYARIRDFSLDRVQLIPTYLWKRSAADPYELKLKSDEREPMATTLTFKSLAGTEST